MNEELDDAAVTAAVAGYPRTGRDLADGYMLAALVIRASYDPHDPEIERSLRLYTGNVERMDALVLGLSTVRNVVSVETQRRARRQERASAELADAASTVLLPRVEFCNWCPDPPYPSAEFHPGGGPEHRISVPRVPGEMTQEIRLPLVPAHRYVPNPVEFEESCAYVWRETDGPHTCGYAYSSPVHGPLGPGLA